MLRELEESNTITKFNTKFIKKSKNENESYVSDMHHINNDNDMEEDCNSEGCKSEKSQDVVRVEEPWTHKVEDLIILWNKDIQEQVTLHEDSGYFYKKKKQMVGLPAVLVPLMMAPFSATFADKYWIQYVNMTSFVLVGFLSGLETFFSFGASKEKHFNHSSRYQELQTYIESQLFKKKKFRLEVDVFLTEVRMRYDNLRTTAPTIPSTITKMNENFKKTKQDLTTLKIFDDNNV